MFSFFLKIDVLTYYYAPWSKTALDKIHEFFAPSQKLLNLKHINLQTRKLQARVTKIGPPDKIVEQYPQEEFLLRLKLYISSTIKTQMNLVHLLSLGRSAHQDKFMYATFVFFKIFSVHCCILTTNLSNVKLRKLSIVALKWDFCVKID